MNKLSKEKRSQLALVVVMSLVLATGLYTGLIRFQQAKLRNLDLELQKANRKLSQIDETSRSSAKIEADLAIATKELQAREAEMVSGDLYSSMVNFVRTFKMSYPVDIKQFSSKGIADINLFTKYPYKQFTVAVTGSTYYHDLGRFIADFENRFPSSRILNLELAPESSQEKEKLTFRMDIVSLVKPSGSPVSKKP